MTDLSNMTQEEIAAEIAAMEGDAELAEEIRVFVADAEDRLSGFETKLGRPLLDREVEAMADVMFDQWEQGQPIDTKLAWEEGVAEKIDMDTDSGRAAFMAERLEDARRAEEPEPTAEGLDLDDDDQRREYIGARMNGAPKPEPDAAAGE